MITRACISINNRCNLSCLYCHFHEKKESIYAENMDIIQVLDNIITYIEKYKIQVFKLGFVGNGEPLLDYKKLCDYILHISNYLLNGRIVAYTITNGILVDREKLEFFKKYNVNVGLSIDGIAEIHNKYRCNTQEVVMEKIELYKDIFGKYPSMNCTVGREILERSKETIRFFEPFQNRITFSRMIGEYGISLTDFYEYMEEAKKTLHVRTGGYDCTMYGGLCGAGIDNIFFANGKIYLCGNCIDLPYHFPADTELDKICFDIPNFNRNCCFRETNYEKCNI